MHDHPAFPSRHQEILLIAKRLRQVGLKRILFGADLSIGGNPQPGPAWERFHTKIPPTEAEFGTIANNTTPYLH